MLLKSHTPHKAQTWMRSFNENEKMIFRYPFTYFVYKSENDIKYRLKTSYID